ncbi:hypothetical protein A7Q01_02075 [Eikenella sp. NML96-A-049]|uniref:hypothetical protein n=1 Tax=Eikenella TaxID=538 RepID=UPI0007E1A8E0|nr:MULTISPECIES: hypothetical protein [Eikenella]OAM37596.1 hypothetical protein A7P98_00085 [Eikenella sp. NML080894]OAM41745.1 hypothetical protein A7Q01_02075 [Eikenella sp. NML96-A-049]
MAKNKPQDDAVQKPLQGTPNNPPEQQEAQGGQTEQQPESQGNLPENQPEQQEDPNTPPEATQPETAPVEQQPEQDAVVQPTADADRLPEKPTEPLAADDAVAVRSRTERFFRCGLEFVRHEWRTVQRSELSDEDWQRLLAEPHLEICPADAPDDNRDVPQ